MVQERRRRERASLRVRQKPPQAPPGLVCRTEVYDLEGMLGLISYTCAGLLSSVTGYATTIKDTVTETVKTNVSYINPNNEIVP